MKENTRMIRNMAMECTLIKMEGFTKENGCQANNMEKGHSKDYMGMKGKANGHLASGSNGMKIDQYIYNHIWSMIMTRIVIIQSQS